MKRVLFGSIPIILLSTMLPSAAGAMEVDASSPQTLDKVTTVELSGRIHEEFFEGLGNKLSGRHRDEFFEGIGNKLSGKHREEFFDGLGNKMIESHREEFFEGVLKG